MASPFKGKDPFGGAAQGESYRGAARRLPPRNEGPSFFPSVFASQGQPRMSILGFHKVVALPGIGSRGGPPIMAASLADLAVPKFTLSRT